MDAADTERLEALCRLVASHDLEGRSLRVVPSSRQSKDLQCPADVGAFTAPHVHALLQHDLGEPPAGGIGVVFNDTLADREYGDSAAPVIRGWCFHEISHSVLQHPRRQDDMPPEDVAVGRAIAAAILARPEPLAEAPDRRAAALRRERRLHDDDFVRVVCHFAWRAERAGVAVSVRHLLGVLNCRGPAGGYFAALAPEYEACAGMSAAEIVARPAPGDFVTLCDIDRRRFDDLLDRLAAHQEEHCTMTIAESIRAVLTGRREAALKSYADVVLAEAERRRLDPAKAAEIVIAAGKSPDDVARDADALKGRWALQEQLLELAELDAEEAANNGKLADIEAERAQANQRFDAAGEPIQVRNWAILQRRRQLEHVPGELRRSAPEAQREAHQAAGRELGAFQAAKGEAEAAIREQNEQIALGNHRLPSLRDYLDFARKGGGSVPEAQQALEATENAIAAAERVISEKQVAIAELNKQIAAAEAKVAEAEQALLSA